MQLAKIRKKSGKMRTICIPDSRTKTVLRAIAGRLEAKARKACPDSVLHGFARGRNPVTNALAHVGHRYTLCMDLEDFFDHVTERHVAKKLSRRERELCLVDLGDGKPRALQGLPTSPAVANLAAADIDRAILRAIDKRKLQIVYTRYADDLTFSFDDASVRMWLLDQIPQIVSRSGFRVAAAKTRFMPASAGLRHITGIAVGADSVRPTRAAKRRLRAARHRARTADTEDARANYAMRARGLAEWCECRLPRPPEVRDTPSEQEVERRMTWLDTAQRLADHWSLGRLPPLPEPAQPETQDGDCIITRDPAYILGMSTYTTGWTSCMRQPGGQYRGGTKSWYGLAGTSIAALLSSRTDSHAGIERRVMRARCLLHQTRDGRLWYDRRYGDPESARLLTAWLEARGARPAGKMPRGARVVGNVPATTRPYCDSLKIFRATVTRRGKRRDVRVFGW